MVTHCKRPGGIALLSAVTPRIALGARTNVERWKNEGEQMKLAFRLFITALLLSGIGRLSTVASSATGTVQIDRPATSTVLSGLIEIRGTALLSSPTPVDFRYYRLEYSRVDERNDNVILAGERIGDVQIRGGLLDTWDTTQVPNGQYIIRLQVYNHTGAVKDTSISVIVSNNLPSLEAIGERVAFAGPGV